MAGKKAKKQKILYKDDDVAKAAALEAELFGGTAEAAFAIDDVDIADFVRKVWTACLFSSISPCIPPTPTHPC